MGVGVGVGVGTSRLQPTAITAANNTAKLTKIDFFILILQLGVNKNFWYSSIPVFTFFLWGRNDHETPNRIRLLHRFVTFSRCKYSNLSEKHPSVKTEKYTDGKGDGEIGVSLRGRNVR